MADLDDASGPSLLLVEDDLLLAQSLGRALHRRGYSVEICHSAADARSSIR